MTPKKNIPSIEDCIRYMNESCHYDCVARKQGWYVFRDQTGTRPLHIREMSWNLNELRHAFNNGW